MTNIARFLLVLLSASTGLLVASTVRAQDSNTTGEALAVPVFDSIDENNVDLITGMLRIRSPLLTMGSGEHQVTFGLEWTGRSWRMLGLPMINREDSKYYVTYNGVTDEFNGYSSGFSQRRPITGAKLECNAAASVFTYCKYTSRDGDVVVFSGQVAGSYPSDYGLQTLAMGNLGMFAAKVTSGSLPAYPAWTYGNAAGYAWRGFDETHHQLDKFIFFGNQQLKITTPNQNGTDYQETYLRPKSTTQTITDDFGAIWQYVVNGDREITRFVPPNGLSAVDYTYTDGHRVRTVTNAAGTWDYSYSDSSTYRTITVTTPTGRKYSVKSHKDNGYVVEVKEAVGQAAQRTTTYFYDPTTHLLETITYPELNRVELEYDQRGNVRYKREYPKPGSTESMLEWQAGYWQNDWSATCTEPVLCNRVAYIIDPKGYRTDFEYAPSGTRQIGLPIGAGVANYPYVPAGHGKPTVIRQPAASTSPTDPRPTTINTYDGSGNLTSSSTCMTTQTCAGTADEVKTEYEYLNVPYSAVLLGRSASTPIIIATNSAMNGSVDLPVGVAITSNGVTQRSCFTYDTNGRLLGETPPAAGRTSCATSAYPAAGYNESLPEAGYAKATPTFAE